MIPGQGDIEITRKARLSSLQICAKRRELLLANTEKRAQDFAIPSAVSVPSEHGLSNELKGVCKLNLMCLVLQIVYRYTPYIFWFPMFF